MSKMLLPEVRQSLDNWKNRGLYREMADALEAMKKESWKEEKEKSETTFVTKGSPALFLFCLYKKVGPSSQRGGPRHTLRRFA
mmetsp:Transcript_20125/g.29878  ORF Transcript_20125/g.29878 Transcript_20125/m.29878 type:complete len:83 (+) Transcript_20125:1917-2165(+)